VHNCNNEIMNKVHSDSTSGPPNQADLNGGRKCSPDMRNQLSEPLSRRSFNDLSSLRAGKGRNSPLRGKMHFIFFHQSLDNGSFVGRNSPQCGMPPSFHSRSGDVDSNPSIIATTPRLGIPSRISNRSIETAPQNLDLPVPAKEGPNSSITSRQSSYLGGDMYGGMGYGSGYGMGYGGMGYGMGYGAMGFGMGGQGGTIGNYIMWLQSLNYTLMSLGSLVQTFGLNAQSILSVAQVGINALDYLVGLVKTELRHRKYGECLIFAALVQ
jgi:hypothetical protein